MRRLGRCIKLSLPAFAAAFCLVAAPAGADWQATTQVPAAGAASGSLAAGLADSGAAAILFQAGSDTYAASRESFGGAWSVSGLASETIGTEALQMEMNAAGDAVAAWRLSDGSGFVFVAYKPAGGAWEAAKALDNKTLNGSGLDVAINSAGTAIVGWDAVESGLPHKLLIRTAIRTKAGSWPALNSYATASSESNGTTGSVYAIGCGGPAVAIDDAGRALAAWSTPYGSIHETFDEAVVCGMRTALWSGSAWSGASDLTPRPAIGNNSTSGAAAPDVGLPVAAADPVSGKLTLAFRYSADAYDDVSHEFFFDEGWNTVVYGGSVAGGPGGLVESPSLGAIGELAAGARGSRAIVASSEFDGQYEGAHSTRAGAGAVGNPFSIGALSSTDLSHPAATVGGDGRSFVVFEDPLSTNSALAWTAPAGSSLGTPRTILAPTTSAPGLAANCHGDGIVAAGNGSGLYYADYRSGETGACGSGGEGSEGAGGGGAGGGGASGGGGQPQAPAAKPAAEPPSNAIAVKAPKSLADGKVELSISFPGPGKVSLTGTAKLGPAGSARAAAKKATVVAQRSATVAAAGELGFRLAPNAAAKRQIASKGKLAAKLAIVFTPTGGFPRTETRGIVFKVAKKGSSKR